MTLPPDPDTARALVEGRHGDPFAHLGPHDRGGWGVTALVPGAERVWILAEKPVEMQRVAGAEGLFLAPLPDRVALTTRTCPVAPGSA